MSTYAVFGMTMSRAREEAKKLIEPYNSGLRRAKTMDEMRAEIDARQLSIFAARSMRLSEMFDAPQFAEEFLERAKTEQHRSLYIRANALTGEVDPKTKRPLRKWVDYPSADYDAIVARVKSMSLL